jgi:YHS domain-containing protein
MHVDEKKAAAAFEYNEKVYYFCTSDCKTAFEQEPEKYIQSRQDPWQQVGKHGCC